MNDVAQTHIPVLLDSVLGGLNLRPGAHVIDGTLGLGGHAEAILTAAPDVHLLGFDRDPHALDLARARLARFGDRVIVHHGSYARMGEVATRLGFESVDAILLDLGLSSLQLDDPARGFAFRHEAPLDMRFDPTGGPTAADLLNTLDERALADLIFRYGEDRYARRIARAVVAARPILTTTALAEIVARAVPGGREKIHPATRTFQALRIAVNDELAQLQETLPDAVNLLRSGGRLAVISFHSLEDRIVKQFMKRESTGCLCPPRQPVCTCGHIATLKQVTRKPIEPDEAEIAANPRARSAKLRIAEKV